jgi:hypothetical protein
MASMFSRMGYDGLFFARLDYQDKAERLLRKTAELIWQGSPNLGKYFSRDQDKKTLFIANADAFLYRILRYFYSF